jgi:enamine deaminase RidA (YjgF/YER057c/UK114 family)
MGAVDDRLSIMGVSLPPVPAPVAAYVSIMRAGDLLFTAGQIPRVNGELISPGRVGGDVSSEQAREAARQAALQAVAAIKSAAADLDQIHIVKVTVFVNSAPGFVGQPAVADGASDVLQQIFGDAGKHARSAVGVAELPLGSCVEVEVIAEVRA